MSVLQNSPETEGRHLDVQTGSDTKGSECKSCTLRYSSCEQHNNSQELVIASNPDCYTLFHTHTHVKKTHTHKAEMCRNPLKGKSVATPGWFRQPLAVPAYALSVVKKLRYIFCSDIIVIIIIKRQ